MKFVGHNTILLNEAVIGRDNLKRRLVKEFVFSKGSFQLTKSDIELSEYLKEEGYCMIPIEEDKMKRVNDTLLIDALWTGKCIHFYHKHIFFIIFFLFLIIMFRHFIS
jgi:hypothetical protein